MKTYKEYINESENKYAISDFGKNYISKDEKFTLPRYGIWLLKGSKDKSEVIETGDDLELLLKKYNLKKENII